MKYICIHGHFYQPPRENAWTGRIEQQESAQPYHDWNERINFECYAPNAVARILEEDRIVQIRNNYKRISFNFGPTLLSWMEDADPDTYARIQEADRRSMELFGGHGNAMAQAHSHLILPLCNHRDKVTQVQWGIHDFEWRFGRYPEGMWLAEAAVDVESLEVLAAHGITFTLLAPRQAKAIRKVDGSEWQSVDEGSINTHRAYWCPLPSGRRIALFFYDGQIAKDVAFNRLLNSGAYFAKRLKSAFYDNNEPELVHIATDGESYGHHHRHGEMALAYALWNIEDSEGVQLTNYGQFLELHPPEYEIQIWDNSSWSCVHGVERWSKACACTSDDSRHTLWREPLRTALDFVRDKLAEPFEKEAGRFLLDPWAARNDFIKVVNDRSPESKAAFLKQHAKRHLNEKEEVRVWRLLEMQRHCVLMYTSCAWFFDDISRIETSQVLQYALRVIEYAEDTVNLDLFDQFLTLLAKAPGNVVANGAVSFEKNVLPSKVNLKRVAMHLAASQVFFSEMPQGEMFNYRVLSEDLIRRASGSQKLALGKLLVQSQITDAEKRFSFAVLHLGAQHIIGNLSDDMTEAQFDTMKKEVLLSFENGQIADIIGVLQKYFGPDKFTIDSLFKEERIKIINQLAEKTLQNATLDMQKAYKESYPFMVALKKDELPIPPAFSNLAQSVIKQELKAFFEDGKNDLSILDNLMEDMARWDVVLEKELSIERAAEERIFMEINALKIEDSNIEQAYFVKDLLLKTNQIEGLKPEFWKIQNHFYNLSRGYRKGLWTFANAEWETLVRDIGSLLKVKLPGQVLVRK